MTQPSSCPFPPREISPPPPYKPRPGLTWDMFPHRRTPARTIEELRSILIVDGNFSKFQNRLDGLTAGDVEFRIEDLGGSSLMTEAIKRDATPFVMELLKRGMPMLRPVVWDAIQYKATHSLELFLYDGWDINVPAADLDPPLLGYAASDESMAIWLLEHGADPNRQCMIDITPLSLAVQIGSVHTVKIMLDDYNGDIHKGQLLHYAIDRKTDTVGALELLLDRGAPINQTMYENHDWSRRFHFWMDLGTALHKAAKSGKVRAARFLLNRGIDASIKDLKGYTALDRARECNHVEIVKLLEDVEGKTAEDDIDHGTPGAGDSDAEQAPARQYCVVS